MSTSHQRTISSVLIVAALAVLGYAVLVLFSDHRQIQDSISSLSALQIAVILGLSLLNYGLRFLRWHGYVSTLGHKVPWNRHLLYYVAGFAFTISPGKAGEGLRAVYLKPYGVSYMDSLAALFMERLLDVLTIAALSALVINRLPAHQWAVVLVLVAVALIALLLGSPALPTAVRRIESRTRIKRVGYVLRHLSDMLASSVSLRRPPVFAGGLIVGLVAWGCEGVGLYLILMWLHADITLPLAVGIYAVGILAGVLSLLPGGLGGAEMAMGFLLTLNGVAPGVAIAATLLCRLCTLWFAVVIGVAAVGMIGLGRLRQSPVEHNRP